MNQAFVKVICSEMVRIVTFPLRMLPIRQNRILFTGLTGGKSFDYSCNPKYLYEYMQEHFPGQFEYVWVVSALTTHTYSNCPGKCSCIYSYKYFGLQE